MSAVRSGQAGAEAEAPTRGFRGKRARRFHQTNALLLVKQTAPSGRKKADRNGEYALRLTQQRHRSYPTPRPHLVGRSSPFMRLVEHLTVLAAWCKQCLLGR